MTNNNMTMEEFDQRLAAATERLHQEQLAIQAENVELRELISQYEAVIERLGAELDPLHSRAAIRSQIKETLQKLSERTASVAASL